MKVKIVTAFIIFFGLVSCIDSKPDVVILTSSDYDNLIEAGHKFAASGRQNDAIQQFSYALSIDSTRIEAYYGLGFVYNQNCTQKHIDCQKAIDYCTKAIRIDSSYRHAFYNRANCYAVMKQYEKALMDLTNRFSLGKEDADYYAIRVVCCLNVGDTLLAHENYTQAVQLNKFKQIDQLDQLFANYFNRE
jgi:tetratricopeptide (TPR) repeat protein